MSRPQRNICSLRSTCQQPVTERLVTATALSDTKREFSVADEHSYNRSSPVRWILSHLLRNKFYLVTFVLASSATALLFSAVPALTGLAFNEVLQPDPDVRRLLGISLAVVAFVLLRGVTDIVNAFSVEILGQRLERDARDELYVSLLGKSQTFHNRQRVGDIMARATNDVRQLNPMMNPGVALIADSITGTIAPLLFIANIHPLLLVPTCDLPDRLRLSPAPVHTTAKSRRQ